MSFYGLEIAKTGLFLSQKAINLAGHNIANANTAGYTRQRIVSEAIDPASNISRFTMAANGRVGGGAHTQSLEQVRDAFIDKELRRECSDQGYWAKRADALDYIETMFDETDSSSLTKSLQGFIDALKEFSKNPSSTEIRTNLRQSGVMLTDAFHMFNEQLGEFQTTQNDSMAATVLSINTSLENIAAYNKSITSYELSGEMANDLRDKRNVELDKLAQFVNIEYAYDSDGYLTITSGGQELLNNTTVRQLEARPDATTGFYNVVFADTGDLLNYTSGELEAYRRMRDGSTADDMGVPYLMQSLDLFAQSLAREINAVHSTGFTLATAAKPSTDGINFFAVPGGDYSAITAGNFSLSADVLGDLNMFAASAERTYISQDGTKANQGDSQKALLLYELFNSQSLSLTSISDFQGYLQGYMTGIGIEAGHTNTMLASQDAVVGNLETRRESVSGVSVDEEMVTLMKAQHMYSASSRIITAIDEALETLINRTGLVGRG